VSENKGGEMHDGQRVTLTVRRPGQDITAELHAFEEKWYVVVSLDENGEQVQLTQFERANIKARARLGQDETGR
jgi:hypothetical protein